MLRFIDVILGRPRTDDDRPRKARETKVQQVKSDATLRRVGAILASYQAADDELWTRRR